MSNSLMLIGNYELTQFRTIDSEETTMLKKASDLLSLGYPEHSLIEIWNACVHNLRRRVESYSIDMFLSSISSEAGRKRYKSDGDTLSQRWSGVDDLVLINGATPRCR